jgi:hypothetical protein
MSSHHLIAVLIGGLLVVAGAFVGTQFLAGSDESAPAVSDDAAVERVTERRATPPPTLGGDEIERVNLRLAAIEQRLEALQQAFDEYKKAVKPLPEFTERMDPGAFVPGGDRPVSPETKASALRKAREAHMGRGYAGRLARSLGLDAKRRKAFLDEYDRLMERVQAKEEEHAEVSREGDVTTIEIPRYPDGGDSLTRSWDDWLGANLTAEERERYDGETGDAVDHLFMNRLGAHDRTIRIDESGEEIKVSERAEAGDGAAYHFQMNGPPAARDVLLENYLHLLK